MTEDEHAVGPGGIVLGPQRPSEQRARADDVEEIAGDDDRSGRVRLVALEDVRPTGRADARDVVERPETSSGI
jgi:hypothetical protein